MCFLLLYLVHKIFRKRFLCTLGFTSFCNFGYSSDCWGSSCRLSSLSQHLSRCCAWWVGFASISLSMIYNSKVVMTVAAASVPLSRGFSFFCLTFFLLWSESSLHLPPSTSLLPFVSDQKVSLWNLHLDQYQLLVWVTASSWNNFQIYCCFLLMKIVLYDCIKKTKSSKKWCKSYPPLFQDIVAEKT